MNVTLHLFQMKKLHWTDSEFDRTNVFLVNTANVTQNIKSCLNLLAL